MATSSEFRNSMDDELLCNASTLTENVIKQCNDTISLIIKCDEKVNFLDPLRKFLMEYEEDETIRRKIKSELLEIKRNLITFQEMDVIRSTNSIIQKKEEEIAELRKALLATNEVGKKVRADETEQSIIQEENSQGQSLISPQSSSETIEEISASENAQESSSGMSKRLTRSLAAAASGQIGNL